MRSTQPAAHHHLISGTGITISPTLTWASMGASALKISLLFFLVSFRLVCATPFTLTPPLTTEMVNVPLSSMTFLSTRFSIRSSTMDMTPPDGRLRGPRVSGGHHRRKRPCRPGERADPAPDPPKQLAGRRMNVY